MDNPVEDITDVILALTTTPPSVQKAAVDKYFTQDAEFIHPFCRTMEAEDSRFQIARIYRWYKILSPQISLRVHSISWDEHNHILYVGITQVFAIWLIPFHKSQVSLVTVLHLVQKNNQLDTSHSTKDGKAVFKRGSGNGNATGGKWYIKTQNDLYQTDQFIKFVLPPLAFIVPIGCYFATLVCVIASYVFAPVTWWSESRQVHFQRPEKPPAWKVAK